MLILNTLTCPPGIPPRCREVLGTGITVGRSHDCDWVLSDPDRILSKRHCLVERTLQGWTVTDISSNGTRLGGVALEPGIPHPLHDGDRVRLGFYEIEARILAQASSHTEMAARGAAVGRDRPDDGGGAVDEKHTDTVPYIPLSPPPASHEDHDRLISAFASGAGLNVDPKVDAARLLFAAGITLRSVLAEIRSILKSHGGPHASGDMTSVAHLLRGASDETALHGLLEDVRDRGAPATSELRDLLKTLAKWDEVSPTGI